MFLETNNVREAIIKSFDKPVKYKEMVLLFGEVILCLKNSLNISS